jgi:hypothetical protein
MNTGEEAAGGPMGMVEPSYVSPAWRVNAEMLLLPCADWTNPYYMNSVSKFRVPWEGGPTWTEDDSRRWMAHMEIVLEQARIQQRAERASSVVLSAQVDLLEVAGSGLQSAPRLAPVRHLLKQDLEKLKSKRDRLREETEAMEELLSTLERMLTANRGDARGPFFPWEQK